MTNPPVGKWIYFDTTVTDANGRAIYHIPEEKRLTEGMYPAKMVVRYWRFSPHIFHEVLVNNNLETQSCRVKMLDNNNSERQSCGVKSKDDGQQ